VQKLENGSLNGRAIVVTVLIGGSARIVIAVNVVRPAVQKNDYRPNPLKPWLHLNAATYLVCVESDA
jgi:hypothetical protein